MKVLIFLSVLGLGGALFQEIVLHETLLNQEGNSFYFRRGVPDLTIYPFIDKIERICHNTRMQMYSNINYEGNVRQSMLESWGCHGLEEYKSFRFFGNPDTTKDSVSLFPQSDLRGEEIYVDRSPFGGITQGIESLAYSGNSSWTIFEGSNFNGRTACLPAGNGTNTIAYYTLAKLNVSTVGSLYKGCLA